MNHNLSQVDMIQVQMDPWTFMMLEKNDMIQILNIHDVGEKNITKKCNQKDKKN